MVAVAMAAKVRDLCGDMWEATLTDLPPSTVAVDSPPTDPRSFRGREIAIEALGIVCQS